MDVSVVLLARHAIEELTSGIGMTGVTRRLVYEMDEDPAEIGSVALAARCVERQPPDFSIGRRRSFAIGGDRCSDGQLGTGCELLLSPLDLATEHCPVDPPPLDVGEVVDGPEQRDEGAVGSPPRLFVGETFDLPNDGAPQVAEPVEEEIVLVGVSSRKVSPLVAHDADAMSRDRDGWRFGNEASPKRGSAGVNRGAAGDLGARPDPATSSFGAPSPPVRTISR